jgi:hypothetical protein
MRLSLAYPPMQKYLETSKDVKQKNGDITKNTPTNPYITKRIFPASSESAISTGGRRNTGQSLGINFKDIPYSALGAIISRAKTTSQTPIDMARKPHLAELQISPTSTTPVSRTLPPYDTPYIGIYQTPRSLPEPPVSKTVFEYVTTLIESGEPGNPRTFPLRALPRIGNSTNILSRRTVQMQGLDRGGEEETTLMAVEGEEIHENVQETLLEMSRIEKYETGLEDGLRKQS